MTARDGLRLARGASIVGTSIWGTSIEVERGGGAASASRDRLAVERWALALLPDCVLERSVRSRGDPAPITVLLRGAATFAASDRSRHSSPTGTGRA
jgi:hypothetical protein